MKKGPEGNTSICNNEEGNKKKEGGNKGSTRVKMRSHGRSEKERRRKIKKERGEGRKEENVRERQIDMKEEKYRN